jgi:ribokinase
VRYAVEMCRRLGVPCMLDPAPVPVKGLPKALYAVDVLTPNEHEASQLIGASGKARANAETLAAKLAARGPKRVVLKMGAGGSALRSGDVALLHAPAFKVKSVDTTAAGDAFTGAMAVALSERRSWDEILRFANAAGALCCTKVGAQPALPTRAAVDELIAPAAASRSGRTTPRKRSPRARATRA